jgi:sugar-specific transcriptional regulator TrmB
MTLISFSFFYAKQLESKIHFIENFESDFESNFDELKRNFVEITQKIQETYEKFERDRKKIEENTNKQIEEIFQNFQTKKPIVDETKEMLKEEAVKNVEKTFKHFIDDEMLSKKDFVLQQNGKFSLQAKTPSPSKVVKRNSGIRAVSKKFE